MGEDVNGVGAAVVGASVVVVVATCSHVGPPWVGAHTKGEQHGVVEHVVPTTALHVATVGAAVVTVGVQSISTRL